MTDAGGKCALCDHDPACGYASVTNREGTYWLCHSDEHNSCYEEWDQSMLADGWKKKGAAARRDPRCARA